MGMQSYALFVHVWQWRHKIPIYNDLTTAKTWHIIPHESQLGQIAQGSSMLSRKCLTIFIANVVMRVFTVHLWQEKQALNSAIKRTLVDMLNGHVVHVNLVISYVVSMTIQLWTAPTILESKKIIAMSFYVMAVIYLLEIIMAKITSHIENVPVSNGSPS